MHIKSSGLQWLQLPFLWDWIFKMYLLNHSMNGLSFFLSMSWSLSLWASLRDGDYKWMCAACVMPINEESLRPVWTQREERAVVPSPYISILNSLEILLSWWHCHKLLLADSHTSEQTWPGAQPFQHSRGCLCWGTSPEHRMCRGLLPGDPAVLSDLMVLSHSHWRKIIQMIIIWKLHQ